MEGTPRGWERLAQLSPRGTGGQQHSDKWSDSGYILKVEPKGFADGSGVAGERKEGQG